MSARRWHPPRERSRTAVLTADVVIEIVYGVVKVGLFLLAFWVLRSWGVPRDLAIGVGVVWALTSVGTVTR